MRYATVDAAVADQRRFESQSLLSEGYAEMGLYGLHSATTRLAVVTLVQQGAPLDGLRLTDWRDEYQHWQTPLLSAYLDDRLEVADALLYLGANVDAPNMIAAAAGGGFGHTALHTLVTSRNLDAATHLVAAGADVNAQTTLGWTPLHFAAQKDDPHMVRALFAANADRHLPDLDGNPPVRFAGPYTRRLFGG